ncbi:hypothetical protein SI65_09964 [Aspergillus cristatus]|uniref:Uncharacterized protein n=1 Tax=Aspergillus cristatus TaxID=573508 RepID=A0A1E3B127_ASPCR|nr:hypothetical protein SI65_09964 [Aspergillus cristatus]
MATLHLKFDDDDPWIIEEKMFNLLNDYLQPSSTKSALKTVQDLDALFPIHRINEDQPEGEPREPPESFLSHLWPLILNTASQMPHYHPSQEKFAELMKSLKGLVSRTPIVSINGHDTKLWGDLPNMYWTIWEELDRMPESGEESKQRWRNASCFLARLTRDRTYDWFDLAISQVGGCLEGHSVFRHAHAHRPDVVTQFIPELDENIELALDWLSICGHLLFDLDKEVEGSGGGPLWNGKLGLCPERWQFWKERFVELGEFAGVAERTRELARKTVDKMEVIEREAKARVN